MKVIDVYRQYFSAQCVYNGVERKGVLAVLTATSDSGTIQYEVTLTFFPHIDPEDFAVSFSTDGSWTPPEGRSRVYVVDANAIDVELYAEKLGMTGNSVNLVFLTALHETRFEEYGVLRPITTMN